jgi:hypothetical protein
MQGGWYYDESFHWWGRLATVGNLPPIFNLIVNQIVNRRKLRG